jgi:hypothetical protein
MIRTLIVPLLFVAGTAFAEPAPNDGTATTEPAAKAPASSPPATAKAQMFEDLDINKDSQLDKTEVAKVDKLGEHFASVDSDKSGKLSKVEYQAWTEKVAEKK